MDGLILGLDLCDGYTQLSCWGREENWTLPTAGCRQKDGGWLIGETAYATALAGEGSVTDKLIRLVLQDGSDTIYGVKYRAVELLKCFLEQVFSLPLEEGKTVDGSMVKELVITVPKMKARLMDGLMYCADQLKIPRSHVHVISHTEAFMYFVLSQTRDVWSNHVGLFDLSEKCLCYYEMKVQKNMGQVTAVAEREKLEEGFALDILSAPQGVKLADKILCSCGERLLEKKLFSSVFLTGKGFETQQWAGEFMKMLCNRRRVFVETVLFAQGAACKAVDLTRDKTAYPYTMICDGRLNTTVAVKVQHQDKEKQLVLAAAGDSWYDSRSEVELILEDQNYIEFSILPQDVRKRRTVKLELEGFPVRDDKSVRVSVQIGFLDERTMVVVVKDKGFGEFYPSTGASIRQEVTL